MSGATSAQASCLERDTAPPRLRAAGVLRAVPDRWVATGSLQLQPAEGGEVRRWVHGPHLSLHSPSTDGSDGLPQVCPADCLQLRWSADGPQVGLVLHCPHQPLARQPLWWVLTIPLEPLLLAAAEHGLLDNLVIDGEAPLQLASGPNDLTTTAAELLESAEHGQSSRWLQLERRLLLQLSQTLQRPRALTVPRGDRGWRHVNVSLAWMQRHLEENFVLPDLAAVAGITPRALQMAYRKHLGKRPLQSLRMLRLAELRRQLLTMPGSSRRLLDHLEQCGLSPSGNMARHYRERYGEKPSQTRG